MERRIVHKKTPATSLLLITGAKILHQKMLHHIVHDGLHDTFIIHQEKSKRLRKFISMRRKISVCVCMSVLSSIERFRSLL